MNSGDFAAYLASLYALKANDPRIKQAIIMAVESFGGKYPWSWARVDTSYTTDSDGIITFDSDFDGTLTMRERDSSAGGWIQPWMAEKFDFTLPRLDNLSGSYARVCKIYKDDDGDWKGQMAPPVESKTIYVMYKKQITSITDIPGKCLDALAAMAHKFMIRPDQAGYREAFAVSEQELKKAWKKDRQNWAGIFKTVDETYVREYVKWWGCWSW